MSRAKLSDLVSLSPRADASYDLFMVRALRDVVANAATLVASASDPAHRAFTRLFGPVDPSVDQDDPLLLLERQSATDDMLELVRTTVHSDVLATEEVFTWVRVLSLSSCALNVLYNPDGAALSPGPLKSLLASHGLIQRVFILALDPTMDDPDQESGPTPS
jgi:hypothetical protein